MGTEELAERLASAAEEIADLALDRLRQAAGAHDVDGAPDPALLAEERRLTRARRAVEKAVQLLRGPSEEDPGHGDV